MDPWHIIEILGIAFIALGWRTMDGRLAEARERIHKLEGRTELLTQANVRSEERDKAFVDTMDRLGKALDRFDTKVDELSKIVTRAYRKFTPHGGMPAAVDPRREE